MITLGSDAATNRRKTKGPFNCAPFLFWQFTKKMGQDQPKKKAWWGPALGIFFRFSAWIVFPVLAGLFIGKWLDKKYGTEPWMFIASMAAAFGISIFGLVKSVLAEYQNIERENQKK